ncbi:MAG: hypothetical protein BGN88_10580 [Clostridiales bacterium 43-6]|nr:MAG: hypothetical protein BGN88_10580 [Clostridiales bacterium 43-6]
MPFTILFAILFAKFKGYKVSLLFKSWTIYPILVAEIILLFFQISVLFGTYYFVQFAQINKIFHLMLFLIPFFCFKLYKEGLIGSISILIGTSMNKFVMFQNDGKMPVFPSLSFLTGNAKHNAIEIADNVNKDWGIFNFLLNLFPSKNIHTLGNINTKWKFFSDYIDFGYTILSIGDLFVHFFGFLIIYGSIRFLNKEIYK